MLNKAILMGRLTRDPELRHTQSNTAVCSFTLAIDRDRKSPSGERQTDFIDCVAWGKQAEFVAQWFTKGMMAIVIGRIQSRQWQDQHGNNRTAIEVHCGEISAMLADKVHTGHRRRRRRLISRQIVQGTGMCCRVTTTMFHFRIDV